MSKFKVGDKVRIINGNSGDNCSGRPTGYEYIIQEISNQAKNWYRAEKGIYNGVAEDNLEIVGNNLNATHFQIHHDISYPLYTGMDTAIDYCKNKQIKPKPIMKTVSNMMKKLLDADTQTLVKAGYINGDLELTCDGQKALTEILFSVNKAALVEAANTKIAEETK